MYGKNTLDKIYLTQKKLLPHPSTSQRGNSSFFQGRIAIPSKAKRRIAIRPYCSLFTAPRSLTPAPRSRSLLSAHCSLFTDPCSLFTALYFMLKISCNTKKIVPLHQITFMGVDWF